MKPLPITPKYNDEKLNFVAFPGISDEASGYRK